MKHWITQKDKIISRLIKEHSDSNLNLNLIDIGAGGKPLIELLDKNISYNSFDIDPLRKPDVIGDINKPIEIESETYDIVICTEVLEHTFYPQKILKELKRITKKNGFLIITMPNEYNFYLRLKSIFGIQNNTAIPFRESLWENHIHQPRVKDLLLLYRKHFQILEFAYSWDSFSGKAFRRTIDKFIRVLLMPLSKNLFSRSVICVGMKPTELREIS